MKDCKTPEQLERIFVIFLNKFPASEGFSMGVHVHWSRTVDINKDEFIGAINKGKGKTYIRRIRNQRQKADWMGFLLDKTWRQERFRRPPVSGIFSPAYRRIRTA